MSYINSDKISIFPLAKIRDNNRDRLFYEHNVANLIRQLIDTEGFIIHAPETLPLNTEIESDYIEFNIYGYHVLIQPGVSLIDDPEGVNAIYAKINLTADTPDTPSEIDGQDDIGVYKGLEIISSVSQEEITSNPTLHILKLYERSTSNENFNICKESLIKFNNSSLKITGIDGQH